jgi:hypothetical protein
MRAYIDNKKGHSLFLGISAANHGISVKTYDNLHSYGRMSSISTVPRIELGYQLLSKPVYFNSILHNGIDKGNAKYNKGLFLQFQPMAGLGYNFTSNNSGGGSIGGGSVKLTDFASEGGSISLLTGGNLYFGKNGRQFFFISFMKNWNFPGYTDGAILTTQYNGNLYQSNVRSNGSGSAFSIGIPIQLGGKKRR